MIAELEHHADAGQYGTVTIAGRPTMGLLSIYATGVTGARVAELNLTRETNYRGLDELRYALSAIADGHARPNDEVLLGNGPFLSIAAYGAGVGYPPGTARLRFHGAGGHQRWAGPMLADDLRAATIVLDTFRNA